MHRYIVIGGAGRAGTTFVVQVLTLCGVRTGFGAVDVAEVIERTERAGLELDIRSLPDVRVVKNPAVVHDIDEILADPRIGIDHVFIPIRRLSDAADSRRRAHAAGMAKLSTVRRVLAVLRGTSVPGGIPSVATRSVRSPRKRLLDDVLATETYELCERLATADIEVTFLSFPRLALDPDYLFEKLAPRFPELTREVFTAAFRACSRPELVHTFGTRPSDGGSGGRAERGGPGTDGLRDDVVESLRKASL